MKFAIKLSAHLTPEWRKQYIDYDGLKEILLSCIDKKTRETRDWDSSFVAFLDQQDVEFFGLCEACLSKVESFFAEKLAEAKRKFATLVEELDAYFAPDHHKFSVFRSSVSRRHLGSSQQSSNGLAEPFHRDSARGSVRFDDERESHADDQSCRRRTSTYTKSESIPHKSSTKRQKKYKGLHDFKLAFSEFYLNLILIQNYQVLNFTGFRKILKKHDKLFRRENGTTWRKTFVDGANFNTNREIDELITQVEDIFTDKLEHGDRSKAMKRLRVPPLSERHNPKAVFRFGFFAGIFLMQAVVIILSSFFLRPLPQYYAPALRIFRSTFLIILFFCLFGLNTYGWRTSGVNHVLIFEIDPRSHLDHFQLLEISFFFAVVWGSAVLLFMYSEVLQIPAYIAPFVLVLFLLLCLLNPFKFFQYKARRWLLRVLFRIFCAPFFEVKFADFWLADQLNSMSFLFPELAFFVCFYTTQVNWSNGLSYDPTINATLPGCVTSPKVFIAQSCQCSGILFGLAPILRALPAWFRFAQCLRRYRDMKKKKLVPHVVNAGKYSTTFLSTACRAWFETSPGRWSLAFYAMTSIIQSTYSYSWDIRMDWGLCDCQSPNRLLRSETVYQYHAYYYVAIVEDFILRFSWTFRIGILVTMNDSAEYLNSILPTAEVIRRFIWNFFRLENEHLNNCGEFRAVRDISIRPERRDSNQNSHQPHSNHKSRRPHNQNYNHSHSPQSLAPDHHRMRTVQSEHVLEAMGRLWSWLSGKTDEPMRIDSSRPPSIEIEMHETTEAHPTLGIASTRSGGDFGTVCDRVMEETEPAHAHTLTRYNMKGTQLHMQDMRRGRSMANSTKSLHIPTNNHVKDGQTISGSADEMCLMRVDISSTSESTTSSKSKSVSWQSGNSSLDVESKGLNQTATSVTLLSETPDVVVDENDSRGWLAAVSTTSVWMTDWNRGYIGSNASPVNRSDPRMAPLPEITYPREIIVPSKSTQAVCDQLDAYENPRKKDR